MNHYRRNVVLEDFEEEQKQCVEQQKVAQNNHLSYDVVAAVVSHLYFLLLLVSRCRALP